MRHDAVLRELSSIAKKIRAADAASAFVASLSQAPGFWRAPLVALAAARAVRSHALGATFKGGACKECGLSAEVELEDVHENGQCLPGDLAEALVVLRKLKTEKTYQKPTPDDVKRFSRLLALVGELPDSAREGQLNAAIGREKLVKGNKYDRRHVIETLGACGILETPEHPGFTTKWTSFAARQDRPSVRVECDPPIAFWTAAHGISAKNVDAWFGHLGVRLPKGTKPRQAAVAKASNAAAKREKRAARATEFAVGDAVAFHLGKRWIAAIVVELQTDKGGTAPVVELLDWHGKAAPSAKELKGIRASGSRWGKEKIRSRAILYGLWTRENAKGEWLYVGSGFAPPRANHLPDPFDGSASVERVTEIGRLAKNAELGGS